MTDFYACTDEHLLPDGRVTLLGASRSVTGAMTRVELGRSALLVDCGVAQGREARRLRTPDAPRHRPPVTPPPYHHAHPRHTSPSLRIFFLALLQVKRCL